MNVNDIYERYFGDKRLTLVSGEVYEVLSDGTLRPVLGGRKVQIGEMIDEVSSESVSNIVTYRFRLSQIDDPFWLALFVHFQESGYTIFIDDEGVLRVTTFGGLYGTTFGIAKNCISLANSTYLYFRDQAKRSAREQDLKREQAGGGDFDDQMRA